MSTRRDARECALQILFSLDLNPAGIDVVLREFWEGRHASVRDKTFVEHLVRGVTDNRKAIDKRLAESADNWDVKRMGTVDRNVLRMALFEMLYCNDIPPVVSINEAVDLAKYFSDTKSGRFVNGILDRVRKELTRSPREGAGTTSRR